MKLMLPFGFGWHLLLLSVAIALCRVDNQVNAFNPSKKSGNLHRKIGFQQPASKLSGMFMVDPSNETHDSNSENGENQSYDNKAAKNATVEGKASEEWLNDLSETSPIFQLFKREGSRKIPPLLVEDPPLLLYDVFLILNLTASISFWVVHRMSFEYIGAAISEGSLLCILWIFCGLYNGAFLNSAVDGHYGALDERGGPLAAGRLGFNTFVNTCSLRVILALVMAILQHRQVGVAAGEDLILMEVSFGILLMSGWRFLHSSNIPRI